ncbi:hypothetical protein [Actinomadura meyerae]|nr:hypothetical protein [Actinomadura meyerae]
MAALIGGDGHHRRHPPGRGPGPSRSLDPAVEPGGEIRDGARVAEFVSDALISWLKGTRLTCFATSTTGSSIAQVAFDLLAWMPMLTQSGPSAPAATRTSAVCPSPPPSLSLSLSTRSWCRCSRSVARRLEEATKAHCRLGIVQVLDSAGELGLQRRHDLAALAEHYERPVSAARERGGVQARRRAEQAAMDQRQNGW